MPHRVEVVVVVGLLVALVGCGDMDRPRDETPSVPIEPVVADIVDGDTIVVGFGAVSEPVRLLGIDTPESVDPNRPVQCFGAEATVRLRELIPPGTPISMVRDTDARDRYGRLLAYIFRADDDLFVNEVLLVEGYADLSIIAPNVAYREQFAHALRTAQTAEAGLWGACGGPDVALDPPAP